MHETGESPHVVTHGGSVYVHSGKLSPFFLKGDAMDDLQSAIYDPRKVSAPEEGGSKAWQAWHHASLLKTLGNYAEILFTEINEGEDRRMGSKDVWLKDVAMPFLDCIGHQLPEIGDFLRDLGDQIMLRDDNIQNSKAVTITTPTQTP